MAKASANQKMDPELKYILISEIIPDPNQPRRYFDEHQMRELFESVKEMGVKQPILVRPHGDQYMVVAGERRFRAASAVKIHFPHRDSIPAMVEELTDKQALEIQITENLQRADVKPMEEAVVFKSLIDSHNLTLSEIALRIGKSEKFVAQRLKLNDLIPDFQEMLEREIINLTQAQEIARVSLELQNNFLDNQTSSYSGEKFDWRADKNFAVTNFYYLSNGQNSLSPAPFNVTDETLNPAMGACTTCPHNSANNSILFEGDKAKCTNPVCFNTKKDRYLIRGLQNAIEAGMIPIVHSYSDYNIPDSIKKYAKEESIKILDMDDYKRTNDVDHPGSWEDYLEENKHWDEDDEEDEGFDLVFETQKVKNDYQSDLEAFKIQEDQIKANGHTGLPAYVVENGSTCYIELKSGKSAPSNSISSPGESEISRIVVREIRAKELDGEKVWTKVRELIPNNLTQLLRDDDIKLWMYPMVIKAINEKLAWHNRKWIADLLENKYPTSDDISKALCALMLDALVGNFGSHLTRGSGNAMMFQYIKFFLPDLVIPIELEQQEIALKRQARVKAKIKELDSTYDFSFLTGSTNSKEEEE